MAGGSWYRCYPSDFLRGCFVLTAEETGVYRTLIDMMYDRSGPIDDDPKELARIAGCSTRQFKLIRDKLLHLPGKLIRTPDGRLFNSRTEYEIRARNGKGEQNGGTFGDFKVDKKPEKSDFKVTPKRASFQTQSSETNGITKKDAVSVARAREIPDSIKKEESTSGLSKAERFCSELGISLTSDPKNARFISQIISLEDQGIDFDLDLLPIVKERAQAKRLPPNVSVNYFARPALEAKQARVALASAPAPAFEDADRQVWGFRLSTWLSSGYWPAKFGPLPRLEGSKAPIDLKTKALELWKQQGEHPREWFCDVAGGFVAWGRVSTPRRDADSDFGAGWPSRGVSHAKDG